MLGLTKPEAYGGAGGRLQLLDGVRRDARQDPLRRVPMADRRADRDGHAGLARFGSDELRKEFLTPAIAGDYVARIGRSQGRGFGRGLDQYHARKDGGDYVINGAKMWITNSLQADWMCLLANTSEGAAHKNKTLIVLPLPRAWSKRRKSARSG